MGRRLNLQHLSEAECEQVLEVIQRDFELRQKEQERLGKIEEDVQDESKKTEVLAKQKTFNDNCCMRCFSRFVFIINPKVQCNHCKYFICKSCAEYDKKFKEYVCNVCLKQKELKIQSGEWFYDNIKNKFKRFGSAKVVRSLYKRRTDSDSEPDTSVEPVGFKSEPIGKRKRPSVQGLFEINIDEPEDRAGSPAEVVEDITVKEAQSTHSFNQPYSCSIATGQETFEHFSKVELKAFQDQLRIIVNEINMTLENNIPTPGKELDMLSEPKNNLVSALSNLSQSLHLAIDNQDISDAPQSPVARHQLVNDIILKHVESFVGRPVNVKSDQADSSPEALEEELSAIILKKVLTDYQKASERLAHRDETEVIHAFTKLSNKATLEQLDNQGYICGSETDEFASHVGELTDAESHFSEVDLPTSEMPVNSVDSKVVSQDPDIRKRRDDFGNGNTMTLSSHDSDSGIVSSPFRRTQSSKTDQSLTSDDSDYQLLMLSSNSETLPVKGGPELNNNTGDDTQQNLLNRLPRDNTGDKVRNSHSSPIHDDTPHTLDSEDAWDVITNSTKVSPVQALSASSAQAANSSTLPNIDDSDMDYMVNSNLIEQEWDVVESKKSPVKTDIDGPFGRFGPRISIASDASGATLQRSGATSPASIVFSDSGLHELSLASSRRNRRDSMDSDATLEEDIDDDERNGNHRRDSTRLSQNNSDDEYNAASDDPDGGRHVPLPSFFGSSRLDFEHGDLDDISLHHHNDDADSMSTFSTEISYGRSWNFAATDSLFSDRSQISAYDNFGDKKVGRDEGPVIMLVPNNGEESAIRVGDKDLDELSDLSENPEGSELSESDSEEDEDVKNVKSAMSRILSVSSGVQTDDLDSAGAKVAPDAVSAEVEKPLQKPLEATPKPDGKAEESPDVQMAKLLEKTPISTLGSETDPKFEERPMDITVLEGEMAEFSCRVTGTEPLDVYWYRTVKDELVTLNDDDACESSRDGDRFRLRMYNVTKAERGQILCIGVNNEGRCTQGFALQVKENTNQRKAPEFIKPLQNVDTRVGSRIKLRAKVSGYPHPKVTWYKDGKKIVPSEHVKTERYGNREYVLVLDYVTLEDDAEFSVTAKNICGEAQSSAQVVVEAEGIDDDIVSTSSLTSQSSKAPSSVQIDDYKGIYPDTEDLLKLAEQISHTRGDVTDTAGKVLRSAGQMSTLERELNAMDAKLNNLEGQVNDQVSMETEAYKEIYRDQILQEHDELQTSASAVRHITSTALDILTSSDSLLDGPSEPQGLKRKSELLSPASSNASEADSGIELKLTYQEFDKLFAAGKITRDQMSSGRVPKDLYDSIQDYLRKEAAFTDRAEEDDQTDHDLVMDDLPTSIDCGLKRVDSKRYKRDYVINRDSPRVPRKHWDVPLSPQTSVDKEVVRSTPAGKREDPHEKINEAQEQMHVPLGSDDDDFQGATSDEARAMSPIAEIDQVEDEIYLAAGKVSSLQNKIDLLQERVEAADDDDDEKMAVLEDEVARAAAQVKGSQNQVTDIQSKARTLKTLSLENMEESRPEQQWHQVLSPTRVKARDDWTYSAESQSATADRRPQHSGFEKSPAPIDEVKTHAQREKSMEVDEVPQLPTSPPPNTPIRSEFSEDVNSNVLIKGQTSVEEIPEARVEFDAQDKLPSVRNLMAKFSHPMPELEEEKKSNFKRVYSLTGRDLPPSVREKLKKQSPAVTTNPNIRTSEEGQTEASSPRRKPLDAVFEVTKASDDVQLQSSPSHKAALGGEKSVVQATVQSTQAAAPSKTQTNQNYAAADKKVPTEAKANTQKRDFQPLKITTNSTSNAAPSPSASAKSTTRWTPASKQGTGASPRTPTTPLTPASPHSATSPIAPPRRKSSTIMARAAFWDTRINEGVASDKEAPVEFPEMPSDSFKQ